METKTAETKTSKHEALTAETAWAYLQFADAMRLATLPNWVHEDLTTSQVKAIFLLAHHGPLAVGKLAELLSIGSPATSILVQQLVEKALAERTEDPQDRRRTLVSLTSQGSRLISGQREQREARLLGWLVQLDGGELQGLLQGLRALNGVIREQNALS